MPLGELIKEITTFLKEIKRLSDELELKNIVLDKYETELKRYRSAAFLEDSFEGTRKHNKELMDLLKRGETMESYGILEAIGIDLKDYELVRAISRHLVDLEAYGLVAFTPKGRRLLG